ncbi:hypothetical protein MCOR03_007333 [Pyricularia oryzae]|nr:hypothetical protein MCOR23_001088 [Pyricularia oryzae]KAI6440046.1 hypothetical protein MCOR22_007487 [Pyricularia oryzae]KAI6472578.1 hypothetical protein MCOR15_000345 [Pyricularia oryzae]KAI6527698.1 hypothetical protein MCOR16_005641 [Pyricularia oryzae]KAI6554439.1 hypothetical protein MCOR03_007333 [Pyricularia oryzae]
MYIPVGARPNSMAELVADLERRQSQNPARGGASSRASTQSANTANTGTTAPTTPARGPAAPKQAPAEAIPIGRQPRSLSELVEDLERRQANRPAVDNDASSVASGQSAPSVASANSRGTSNAGRGRRPAPVAPAPAVPAAPAPALGVAPAAKAINGRSEDLVDFLVGLDRRQARGQARGGRTGSSSPSAQSSKSAPSVSSVDSSNVGRGQQPPPPAAPAPPPALPPPAAAPPAVAPPATAPPAAAPPAATPPIAALARGARSDDLVDFLVDINRRQARPAVGSQASSAPSRQSANSRGTNNSVGTSRAAKGRQRGPGATPPAVPAAPVPAPALGVPATPAARAISGRSEDLTDFLVGLDRRQSNARRPGRGGAASGSSGNSVDSANTNNSAATSNGRQRAPAVPAPARPAPPAGIAARSKSINIGEQPSSMAELMADLDRRQANRAPNGRDDATSVASGQSANSAPSVNSAGTSNAGTGRRPAAPGRAAPAPAAPATRAAVGGRSIPIGGQPNSLAELLADLEKRQEKKDGKASSVSSKSSKSAKSVKSKAAQATTSSAPAQATQPSSTLPAQSTQPPAVLPGQAEPTPSPSTAPPAQTTPAAPEGVNGPAQSPAPAPTSAGAGDKVNGALPLPTTLQTLPSEPPRSTVLPTPQNNVAQPVGSSSAGIDPQPQMNGGMVAGAIVGSIAGVAVLAAIIFFLFRRQRRRDSVSGTERRGPNWESRLYGSERSTVSGGTRNTIRSFFARRSAAAAPQTTSETQQNRLPSHFPTLPKSAFDSRRSERSTGLSALDEKQYKTYQNLVGRLNEKQPVPFDHPYYQNDDWR